jgi:hypothetical protein
MVVGYYVRNFIFKELIMKEKIFTKRRKGVFLFIGLLLLISHSVFALDFDFKQWLSGYQPTLFLSLVDIYIDQNNKGQVKVTGGDSAQPQIEFTWDWGDLQTEDSWFLYPPNHPNYNQHTYDDPSQNYVLKVTAHYGGNPPDHTELLLIEFVTPTVTVLPAPPPDYVVTIPTATPAAINKHPGVPSGYGLPAIDVYEDTYFDNKPVKRPDIQDILSVCNVIQKDLVNNEFYIVDGGFKPEIYKHADSTAAWWFTEPLIITAEEWVFQNDIQWSSLMHEMGHMFTLNTPPDYFYGDKTDGIAGAFYSETMAQIFAHATSYILINEAANYNIGDDYILKYKIKESATDSMTFLKSKYDSYISHNPMEFCSWNDPNTSDVDESMETFMTVAYKFFEYAETINNYQDPLKKMMEILQGYDAVLREDYYQYQDDSDINNELDRAIGAERFRAAFMVSAIDYAFSDYPTEFPTNYIRDEFINLAFPIVNDIYERTYTYLIDRMSGPVVPAPLTWNEYFGSEPGGSFSISEDTRTWSSVPIDISGVTEVTLSADIWCGNQYAMDQDDYLNLYYSIDGGGLVGWISWSQKTGGFTPETVSVPVSGISGNFLRVHIGGATDEYNETYYVDNVSVAGGGGGCTCVSGCDSTILISPDFYKNGSGEFCYEATSLGDHINSWNLAVLEVNGVDFTNTWFFTNHPSFPDPIEGKYYVYYKSYSPWGHFEAVED